MQRIVVIARSANDRGANQLITAAFALHDPILQSVTDFSLSIA
jgi:hypothetical protein